MDRDKRKCCNPFEKKHTKYTKLFYVSKINIENAKAIGVKIKSRQFICGACRKQLSRGKSHAKARGLSFTKQEENVVDLNEAIGSATSSDSTKDTDSGEDISDIDVSKVKKAVNELLIALKLDVIDDAKLRGKKYQTKIMNEMTSQLNRVLFPQANPFDASEQMIKQLKDKFNQATKRDMKVKILSLFPQNWSFHKFREVLGDSVSNRMVYQTRKLVQESGILCDTTKKIGSKKSTQLPLKKFMNSIVLNKSAGHVLAYANMCYTKVMAKLKNCNVV